MHDGTAFSPHRDVVIDIIEEGTAAGHGSTLEHGRYTD